MQAAKKRAFTLIEILIAVMLISIILIFLYGAVNNFSKSNRFYEKKIDRQEIYSTLFKALYLDFVESTETPSIVPFEKEIDRVFIRSKNSFFNIYTPYVAYYVNSHNELFRMESNSVIKLPPTFETVENLKFEKIADDVEYFKIFPTSDKKYIFYIKLKEKKEFMFEL